MTVKEAVQQAINEGRSNPNLNLAHRAAELAQIYSHSYEICSEEGFEISNELDARGLLFP
jgi:hypothetical protein